MLKFLLFTFFFPPTHSHRPTSADTDTIRILQARLKTTLGGELAPRTLQARTYLAQRLADFLSANGLPRNEQSMLLFLEATRTKPTSRLTYLNHLKHVLNPRPLAESYARALRRSAAITPLRQAPPLSQPEINKLYSCLPPNERPLLYLALRSGMRLDELTNLAPIHVLEAHPTRISLYWGAHTKSSRLSPFEPQLFVVVGIPHPHNQYHPPNYMKEAATLLSRPRSNRPYTQLTARQWLKMLRLANPNATGHSLKRTTALRPSRSWLQTHSSLLGCSLSSSNTKRRPRLLQGTSAMPARLRRRGSQWRRH